VLLWRVVNLIVFKGIKPEEIFLSTFTEKAAHQLHEGSVEMQVKSKINWVHKCSPSSKLVVCLLQV
jgi:superfamily I DNA/RNA helicase